MSIQVINNPTPNDENEIKVWEVIEYDEDYTKQYFTRIVKGTEKQIECKYIIDRLHETIKFYTHSILRRKYFINKEDVYPSNLRRVECLVIIDDLLHPGNNGILHLIEANEIKDWQNKEVDINLSE